MLIDSIGMPIAAQSADGRTRRDRTKLAHVIFDQRAGRPAIDAKIIETTADGSDIIADDSGGSGVPALAGHDVSNIGIGNGKIAGISSCLWKRYSR